MTKRFAVSAALASLLLVTGCNTNVRDNATGGGNTTGANNAAGGAYAGNAAHNDAGAGDRVSGRAGDHLADPSETHGVGQGGNGGGVGGSAQNTTGGGGNR